MKIPNKVLAIPVSIILIAAYFIALSGCEKKPEKPQIGWVESTYTNMAEDQRIGQLFCMTVDPIKYFLYPNYTASINFLIGKYKPGAIFLLANLDSVKMEIRNEFNANKLHDEIIKLQNLPEISFFIAANFESGAWYWDNKATHFPFPLALGATRSGEFAYRQGKITAVEAKAQGINWVLSPMVNISIDLEENALTMLSLGSDTGVVNELCPQFIKGCQEVGVAGSMKYFPSHKPFSLLTMSPDDITPDQLSVFKAGIETGVLTIMGSTLGVIGGDIHQQTSVTQQLISGVLKKQLGFNGIFISNLAITNRKETINDEMSVILNTVDAGVDMFILPEITDNKIPLIDLILEEAISGRIDMTAIDAASLKILSVKYKQDLHLAKSETSLRSMVGIGLPEYYQTSNDISNGSITLLKNERNIIPVDLQEKYIVSIAFIDDISPNIATIYSNKLDQISDTIKSINIFGIPDQRIEYEAIRRATEADVVICSFFLKPDADIKTFTIPPEIKSLINRIDAVNNHIIIISFYDPYLINYLPEIEGYIVPYSPSQHSIGAAVDVIFGNIDAQGKLPIQISDRFPIGFGISTGK